MCNVAHGEYVRHPVLLFDNFIKTSTVASDAVHGEQADEAEQDQDQAEACDYDNI